MRGDNLLPEENGKTKKKKKKRSKRNVSEEVQGQVGLGSHHLPSLRASLRAFRRRQENGKEQTQTGPGSEAETEEGEEENSDEAQGLSTRRIRYTRGRRGSRVEVAEAADATELGVASEPEAVEPEVEEAEEEPEVPSKEAEGQGSSQPASPDQGVFNKRISRTCCQGPASLREPSPLLRSRRRRDPETVSCRAIVGSRRSVDAVQDQARLKKETAERLRQP